MADDEPVACPSCQKRYRWKAELAGKRVRCLCGAVLRFPLSPGQPFEVIEPAPTPQTLLPPAEPPDSPVSPAPADNSAGHPQTPRPGRKSAAYELQLEDSSDAPSGESTDKPAPKSTLPGRCPNCGTAVGAGAVLCLNCGFHLAQGRRLQTQVHPADAAGPADDTIAPEPAAAPTAAAADDDDKSPRMSPIAAALALRQDDHPSTALIDLYLPLALVAVGLIVAVLEARYFAAFLGPVAGMLAAVGLVVIYLVIAVPLLLISSFVASAALGVDFGPLWTGLLKLTAIAVGPGALAEIIFDLIYKFSPTLSGGAVGLIAAGVVSIFTYWMLIMVFFSLNGTETRYTTMIITMVQAVAIMLAIVLYGALF